MDDAVVTVRVELAVPLAETVTVEGFIAEMGAGPLELGCDSTVVVNDKLPAKELRLFTVMVEKADCPGGTGRELGLALRLKSGEAVEILHAVRGCISHPEKL